MTAMNSVVLGQILKDYFHVSGHQQNLRCLRQDSTKPQPGPAMQVLSP